MYKNRRKQEEKHTHTTDLILSNDKMDFSIRNTCTEQFTYCRARPHTTMINDHVFKMEREPRSDTENGWKIY